MKHALVILTALLFLAAPASAPFAQGTGPARAPAPETKVAPKAEKTFVCQMCNFSGDKAGKCPKCGMDLKEVNKSDIYYECDMCLVKADKPGKCPKCGMNTTLKVQGSGNPASNPHAGHSH